jgi:hypothetical protein
MCSKTEEKRHEIFSDKIIEKSCLIVEPQSLCGTVRMQDNVLASTLVESSGIWIQGDFLAASSAHSLQFHIVLQTFIGEEDGEYVEAEVWRENFQPVFFS